MPVGKTLNISLEYRLSQDLAEKFDQGSYSLYLQKQPGKKVKNVKVDVMTPSEVKSYEPLTGVMVDSSDIVWNFNLDTDREIKINF